MRSSLVTDSTCCLDLFRKPWARCVEAEAANLQRERFHGAPPSSWAQARSYTMAQTQLAPYIYTAIVAKSVGGIFPAAKMEASSVVQDELVFLQAMYPQELEYTIDKVWPMALDARCSAFA